jgi:D-alanyl-D-alanine carboxypeptidase/D-alanyl-D-alanine-endopeptidase (penicillin-binding protein 4)
VRRRRLGWLAACALLAAPTVVGAPATVRGAFAPPVVDAPDESLGALIEATLADPALADATMSVSVVDLATGDVLFRRGDTTALNPASNVKLVTTAAALGLLGPEHRYATRVLRADGALGGDAVRGDVWLVGSGDPDLVTADLYELATQLRAQGIKRITGGVVVDASRFDADGLPPGFDQKEELASYRAPSGAVSVNFNTFVIQVRPGGATGSTPLAGLDPPAEGIDLVNEATTVTGSRRGVWAAVEPGDPLTVRLRGQIGVDAGAASLRYPIAEPSQHAGHVFAYVLRDAGIKIGRRKVKAGLPPEDARLLAVHNSDALSVLIRAVNKYSNNFMAEQILKTLAPDDAPATFAAALRRVTAHVAKRGVPKAGLRYGNGSGLYDTNRISAGQLTALLRSMYADFRVSSDYLASLSIMGQDGTTRRRNREGAADGWVRGKTGTLDGVSCLTGYAGARGRDPIAFSILFNDIPSGRTSQARAVQDRIAELLARHAAKKPLVTTEERAAAAAAAAATAAAAQ